MAGPADIYKVPRRLLTLGVLAALCVAVGSVLLRRAATTDLPASGPADGPGTGLVLGAAPAVTTTSGAPGSAEQFARILTRRGNAAARIDYRIDGAAVTLVLDSPDTRADRTVNGRPLRVYGDDLLGPTTVCRSLPDRWRCQDVGRAGTTAARQDREAREDRAAREVAPLLVPPDLDRALQRRLDGVFRRTVAGRAATCARFRATSGTAEREVCADDELGVVLWDRSTDRPVIEAIAVDAGHGGDEDAFIPPA